jgi:hypothetical protein
MTRERLICEHFMANEPPSTEIPNSTFYTDIGSLCTEDQKAEPEERISELAIKVDDDTFHAHRVVSYRVSY